MRPAIASVLSCCAFLVLLLVGCETNPPLAPDDTSSDAVGVDDAALQRLAADVVEAAGWEIAQDIVVPIPTAENADKSSVIQVVDFAREVIIDDIVHYSIDVRVNAGPYGVIGLHRVVREARPYRPVRAAESLFMVHGDGVDFVNAFLPVAHLDYLPDDHGLPVFLARHDVDVWGIDLAWTAIPADETDFAFAVDWGVQRDVGDIEAGIAVARLVRLLTGNGWRKLDLLGFSTGAQEGWVLLNEETRLPRGLRQVQGFIPVDATIKVNLESEVAKACTTYASIAAARAEGTYVDSTGALAQFAAYLADADPQGDSPIFPGYTNLQVVLAAVSQTDLFFGGDSTFHLLAGVFDENFVPVSLRYADTRFAIDFYASWAPFQPNRIALECQALMCGEIDLPYDDRLDLITVPILCLAPAGGTGNVGNDMENLVGSDDFQTLVVSVDPDPMLDLGHVDIFAAYNGVDLEALLFQPILDWMRGHYAAREVHPLSVLAGE